jgi:transposase InsO family protein
MGVFLEHGVEISMSRQGNLYVNSLAESFIKTLCTRSVPEWKPRSGGTRSNAACPTVPDILGRDSISYHNVSLFVDAGHARACRPQPEVGWHSLSSARTGVDSRVEHDIRCKQCGECFKLSEFDLQLRL